MTARLEQFDLEYAAYIQERLSALLRQGWIAALLLLVFALGLCTLALWGGRRNMMKDTDQVTTCLGRIVFLLPMIALLVLQYVAWRRTAGGAGNSILSWENLLLAAGGLSFLIGAVGILMMRSWGIWGSLIFFWISLPLKELPLLKVVLADANEIALYHPGGQAAIYSLTHMMIARFLILEATAAVLSAVLLYYFSVRRLYLKENRAVYEMMAALEAEKAANGGGSAVAETFRDAFADEMKGKIKSFAIGLVVLLLVVIPMFTNSLRQMTAGSAAANNAYVEALKAWDADETLAEDPEFMADFKARTGDFVDVNARVLYLHPGIFDFDTLHTYIAYTDAAYRQMAVLWEIEEAMEAGDAQSVRGRFAALDATNEAMIGAMMAGFRSAGAALNNTKLFSLAWFTKVEHIYVDGLRYWLRFIGLVPPAMIAALPALFVLGFGLVKALRRKAPKGNAGSQGSGASTGQGSAARQSLTRPAGFFEGFAVPVPEELTARLAAMDPEQAAQQIREKRKEQKVLGGVAIVFTLLFVFLLAVGSLLGIGERRAAENGAVSDHAQLEQVPALMDWLMTCETDPAEALAKKDEARVSILAYQAALDGMIAAAADASADASDGSTSAGAQASSDLLDALNITESGNADPAVLRGLLDQVLERLDNNELPDRELSSQILQLMQAELRDASTQMIRDALDMLD